MKIPDSLTGEARTAWIRFSKLLKPEAIDGPALQMLCITWAEWYEATQHLTAETLVTLQNNGYSGPNPWLKVKYQVQASLERQLASFLFTRAARAKLLGESEPEMKGLSVDD